MTFSTSIIAEQLRGHLANSRDLPIDLLDLKLERLGIQFDTGTTSGALELVPCGRRQIGHGPGGLRGAARTADFDNLGFEHQWFSLEAR
ncbi:MAG: hypothetical protein F8N39_11540 [Clostridiaceae bacterium]|nr:hypothetical protein [Clostridiaceae bacterium]